MHRHSLLAAAALSVAASTAPALAEPSTIRIVPNNVAAATVSLEQGVRVWRPLPPTRQVIVNPSGAPVSLNITDVREHVHYHGRGGEPVAATATARADAGSGSPGYFVGRAFPHSHPKAHPKPKPGGVPKP